jgi:L-2-hydroxyglutarate oxidase LhgO
MAKSFDFVIAGAGIMGLAIARELHKRFPASSIAIFEKESGLGTHASGRNSGVLHSGIYYTAGSLKARLCAEGAREMAEYCVENKLPIRITGKVILPVRKEDDPQIDVLLERAHANGARASLLNQHELSAIEPEAVSCTGRALHSPDTAVVDPIAILNHLARNLKSSGVSIFMNTKVTSIKDGTLHTSNEQFQYAYLFNTAGVFADTIAREFGIAEKYTILPFRGSYYKLDEKSGIRVNSLIYPVPDMRVPFLGVHFTRTIDDHVYLGPTATPALGREHYSGIRGVNLKDANRITKSLVQQYYKNAQGFRLLVHDEIRRLFRNNFAADARAMLPRLRPHHLIPCNKSGIRAQLLDLEKCELVMDFLVEHTKNSTHILNAVSPAFTSSFRFARYVLDEIKSL